MEDMSRGRLSPSAVVGRPAGMIALLAQMLAANDQDSVWRMGCDAFHAMGFAHLIYGYSPDSRGLVLGAREDFLVMSTLDRAVIEELVARGYFRQSATFHWALTNVGIGKWSRDPATCDVPVDFEVTTEALDFFIRHQIETGCCIGLSQPRSRGRAVMALVGQPGWQQDQLDGLIDTHHDAIFAIAGVMHRCLAALPFRVESRALTPRQREVLEWVAHGKTTADISLIMGIAAPTVEKHLRLARETLGVDTTAHALIKAAFLNQVFISVPTAPPVGNVQFVGSASD